MPSVLLHWIAGVARNVGGNCGTNNTDGIVVSVLQTNLGHYDDAPPGKGIISFFHRRSRNHLEDDLNSNIVSL